MIVAGRVQLPTGTAFAVFKLDATSGLVLWPAAAADFPLGTANALALTSHHTVAVAGVVDGSFAVLEFDTSTGLLVVRGGLSGPGEATSVAFDDLESTVVAGGSVRSGPFGSVMTVGKFNGNGTVMWSAEFGGEDFASAPAAIAVHQETGAITVGSTLSGLFTAMQLRPDGVEAWRRAEMRGAATSIAIASNHVVAAGHFFDGNTTVFALIAYTPDGTEQWRRTFRGTADFGSNSAAALAIDAERGAIVAAGVVTDNPTGPDMFAVGLGVDGGDLSGGSQARSLATRSMVRMHVVDEGVVKPAELVIQVQ